MNNKIRTRSEVPQQDKWAIETVFATDEAWETAFSEVKTLIPQIGAFKGTLGESVAQLGKALNFRAEAQQKLEKVYLYAHMRNDEDKTNSKYDAMYQRMNTLMAECLTAAAYIEPELLTIPEDKLKSWIAGAGNGNGLAVYTRSLELLIEQKHHMLSGAEEALVSSLSDLTQAPEEIIKSLTNADLKFPKINVDGQKIQLTESNFGEVFLKSKNSSVRKAGYKGLFGVYKKHGNAIASAYSFSVKKDVWTAKTRKYASSLNVNLDSKRIPVEVYQQQIDTIRKHFPTLDRYLKIIEKKLDKKLGMEDLYVPLVEDVDFKITFPEARELVLKALAVLGEEYVGLVRRAFDERWIDIQENVGKRNGAYSSGVYGTVPFILLNWQGGLRDLFTLIHELGHSMHTYLSHAKQPYQLSEYTIELAEIASTTNEFLLARYLLDTIKDKKLRLYIINYICEQFRTTMIRQTLFAEFELKAHQIVEAGGALTLKGLTDLYLGIVKEYYGRVVTVDDLIGIEWARIHHFYRAYYVYTYANGMAAAVAIASSILAEGQPMVDRYLEFLSSGSCDDTVNILRKAGVDMTTSEPVDKAMHVFADYVDEFDKALFKGNAKSRKR